MFVWAQSFGPLSIGLVVLSLPMRQHEAKPFTKWLRLEKERK
jgi:hypothetical protein